MDDRFRVFALAPGANATEPGGALYVPRHRQGAGRIDNPDVYGVLYCAASPNAAVAERLQGFRGQRLAPSDLRTPRRGTLALARYSGTHARECDLDTTKPLAERKLIPSDVATGDRTLTQSWAYRIWKERRWSGVRYWSSLEAKWPVIARWSLDDLRVEEVEHLTVFHPAIREATEFLGIEIGG